MKFDRFLAKLFGKKCLTMLGILALLVVFLTSCRFTCDDCWYCYCFGCLSPETCRACEHECSDACDASCHECNSGFTDCLLSVGCIDCHDPEMNEELSESCLGKCTVHVFGCMSDSCEECGE